MNNVKLVNRKRLRLSFLVSLIFLACCFCLISVKLPNSERKKANDITISYIAQKNGKPEDLFNEQSDLLDTQSIFLPSKWSTEGDLSLSITNKSLFEDFPEGTLIKKNKDIFPKRLTITREDQNILSVVDKHSGGNFNYFSIKESETEKLKERHALLTVKDMRTGSVILRETIEEEINFPKHDSLWKCGQFQHIIDKHIIPPEPLLLNSSGIDSINSFISVYIKKNNKINNLPDGYYEISFEP